ncbi:MAG: helix-turn-helix domain-containing protein [Deferribacterales bacterium]
MMENRVSEDTFIGAQIKKAMRERGLRNKDLCALSGLSPSALSNYTNSRRVPDFHTIVRIAAALCKPLEYFSYAHAAGSGNEPDGLVKLAEIIRGTSRPVMVDISTERGIKRLELNNVIFADMLIRHEALSHAGGAV